MHKLIDYVCDELKELEHKAEKGDLTMAEVQYADTLAHLKKNLLKSEEMEDGEYSTRGMSYARGRKRDSMGRYSRDKYAMMDRLHDISEDAPDEMSRREIEKLIKKMETM